MPKLLRLFLSLFGLFLILITGVVMITRQSPGYIAFTSTRDGERAIYVMQTDGRHVRRLTEKLAVNMAPQWSPNGRWLIFSGSNTIYIIQPDGRSLQTMFTWLYNSHYLPSWSPDSQFMIYSGGASLYHYRLSTHQLEYLSPGGIRYNVAVWLNRETVVYLSGRTTESGEIGELFLFRVPDEAPEYVLELPVSHIPLYPSPDGHALALASFHEGNYDIYHVDVNGKNLTRLTANPTGDLSPVWSADGQWIVFESDSDGNWNIYRIRPDGSDLQPLTHHPASDRFPTLSPDGQWLAFSSNRSGEWQLYKMRIGEDDETAIRLTRSHGSDTSPVWWPADRPWHNWPVTLFIGLIFLAIYPVRQKIAVKK